MGDRPGAQRNRQGRGAAPGPGPGCPDGDNARRKDSRAVGWPRGLPFVSQRGESWAYHDVVRAAKLRLRRAEAPIKWRSARYRLIRTTPRLRPGRPGQAAARARTVRPAPGRRRDRAPLPAGVRCARACRSSVAADQKFRRPWYVLAERRCRQRACLRSVPGPGRTGRASPERGCWRRLKPSTIIPAVLVVLGVIAAGRSVRVVQQFEQGIVFRFGKIQSPPRGGGTDVDQAGRRPAAERSNMQIVAMAVPAQDGITKDNVIPSGVDAVGPRLPGGNRRKGQGCWNVQNYLFAVSQQAQTSLRSIIGQSARWTSCSRSGTRSTASCAASSISRPRARGASGSSGWRSRTSRCPTA